MSAVPPAGPPAGPSGSSPDGPPASPPGPSFEAPDRCGRCGSGALTRMQMVLTDGTDVTFVSCQACEHRAWFTVGEDGAWTSLPITSVLERSARKPR